MCPFISACSTNNVPVIQWLLGLPTGHLININADNDRAFRQCCENGHIDMAKLLYQTGTVSICASNNYSFIKACENGHFDVVRWLHSLGADIHSNNDEPFCRALLGKHIGIAKWLHRLGNIDISANRMGISMVDLARIDPAFHKGLQRLATEFN